MMNFTGMVNFISAFFFSAAFSWAQNAPNSGKNRKSNFELRV
tara:strand:- start:2451 stop:2576 length:126 start_codon:yes stop_codon:yes gene_type:complete